MDLEIFLLGFASGMFIKFIIDSINNSINNSKDIKQIKESLDNIVTHFGISSSKTKNIDSEIMDMIVNGKKIKAIKRYREVTGYGLKEAKDHIDKLSEGI